MSNYRDDAIATAVASDSAWVHWGALGQSIGRVAATATIGIGVLASASATVHDEVFTHTSFLPVASAEASDEASTQLHAVNVAHGAARASDIALPTRVGLLATATATASDEVRDVIRHMLVDSATASAAAIAQRGVATLAIDTAQGSAVPVFRYAQDVTAAATAAARAFQHAHARQLAKSSATASAQAIESYVTQAVATTRVKIQAEAFTTLHAKNISHVQAWITDEPVFTDGIFGQAWTANTETWAMSRYAPYGFDHIAAIDGVLYGCNEDGVYRLHGHTETIDAHIETGKLDLGEGLLVHPVSAYLEYELVGGDPITIDVTTTQSGSAQTYSYALPSEVAGELTNGRATFGRGLRGRHFSLSLRMTGTRGHINDLAVMHVPTKRRV